MGHERSRAAIRERRAEGREHNYLRDWVYGGIDGPWWRSALETLGVGGGAAAVAYGIGAWLRGLAG